MEWRKIFKFIRDFRRCRRKGHLHHAFTFDFLDFLDEHKQFQGMICEDRSLQTQNSQLRS